MTPNVTFTAACGLNDNVDFTLLCWVKNVLASGAIQRAIDHLVKFKIEAIYYIKNGDIAFRKLHGNTASIFADGNHFGPFVLVSHFKFLLKLIKRPRKFGDRVGECNNILGESELLNDGSAALTFYAMRGRL